MGSSPPHPPTPSSKSLEMPLGFVFTPPSLPRPDSPLFYQLRSRRPFLPQVLVSAENFPPHFSPVLGFCANMPTPCAHTRWPLITESAEPRTFGGAKRVITSALLPAGGRRRAKRTQLTGQSCRVDSLDCIVLSAVSFQIPKKWGQFEPFHQTLL